MARPPKNKSIALAETKAQEQSIITAIAAAARDPKVDVEKMQGLLALQERVMKKQAEIAFNKAMARLQKVLPVITKHGMIEFVDKKNNQRATPYARYEDIDAAIRPYYIKEGFDISFDSKWTEQGAIITAYLSHEDGHQRTAEMRLPLDTSGSKNSLQAMGSTISYGRRYLVSMLLNIVTKGEDDDGNTGANKPANSFADRVRADDGMEPALDVPYENISQDNEMPANLNQARQSWHVIIDGKRNNKIFSEPAGAGRYLKAVISKRNHKQSRIDLIAENTDLLRAIAETGNEALVKEMHDLADKGQ